MTKIFLPNKAEKILAKSTKDIIADASTNLRPWNMFLGSLDGKLKVRHCDYNIVQLGFNLTTGPKSISAKESGAVRQAT